MGCVSQQSKSVPYKAVHPGNYDLIDMGKLNEAADSFHIYKVHTKIIHASPKVVHPSEFTVHLLEHTEIKKGESVLEIGTGTGVQAMFAADNASHVLAMDINKDALENTLHNANRLGLSKNISVRQSDVLNALKPDEKFDVIISGIPFATNERNQGTWELHERFFRDVGKHLNPNGRIYFSTGLLRNMPRTIELAEKNKLKIIRIDMDYSRASDIERIIYVLKQEKYAKWLIKDLEAAAKSKKNF